MLYRPYGKTQFQVSRLGYGVMRLPVDDRHNVDMDEAVKVLRHAYDAGINIFDTHHNYHRSQSEEALGHAFADVRDQVFIQTKNPFYRGESGADTYRTRLEAALKRLQTDYVDGYMAHSVSPDLWETDGHGDAFVVAATKFRDEGLVRFVGFSAHGKPEFVNKLIDTGQFDLVLFQYNLLDRAYEPCFAHAHAQGVATGVMGPMGGGMLGPPTPEVAAMYPPGIASTPELCLRFVLSNENIDVAFSGMTQPEWIDQNAEVVSHLRSLVPADRKRIEAAVAEKKKLAELYCTACNYCMPCLHGVDIPRNSQFMNLHRLYGATEFARRRAERAEGKLLAGTARDSVHPLLAQTKFLQWASGYSQERQAIYRHHQGRGVGRQRQQRARVRRRSVGRRDIGGRRGYRGPALAAEASVPGSVAAVYRGSNTQYSRHR